MKRVIFSAVLLTVTVAGLTDSGKTVTCNLVWSKADCAMAQASRTLSHAGAVQAKAADILRNDPTRSIEF